VPYQHLTYPSYESPLLEAYRSAYESVYIVLHPFINVPEPLAWKTTKQYPTDEQILRNGTRCTWAHVASKTGLGNCAKLNQALLTSIRSINEDLCDYAANNTLQRFLESESTWMPSEGRFEPLLHADLLNTFASAGQQELIFIPEFPTIDPIHPISIHELRSGQTPFPSRGTLAAPDRSFLLTVDWDSFFTLFYGPRAFIAETARRYNLEGFFAQPTTEHAWFNYSIGCSAVTIYPDSWITA
jgi:hypothetical protein